MSASTGCSRRATVPALAALIHRRPKTTLSGRENRRAQNAVLVRFSGAKRMDSTPLREMRTISPAPLRAYSASIRSNAHVPSLPPMLRQGVLESAAGILAVADRVISSVVSSSSEYAPSPDSALRQSAGRLRALLRRSDARSLRCRWCLENRRAVLKPPPEFNRVRQVAIVA